MAIPETRYKRSVLPTAASDRSSRTRKAPEIFTFTSSKVAPKTKGRGRPKNKANTNTNANTGRVGKAGKVAITKGRAKAKGKLTEDTTLPRGFPGKKVFHKELKSTGLEWEVKKIVDSKIDEKGARFYKVQWEHYPAKDSTWEPEINLYNCPDKIAEFDAKFPTKP